MSRDVYLFNLPEDLMVVIQHPTVRNGFIKFLDKLADHWHIHSGQILRDGNSFFQLLCGGTLIRQFSYAVSLLVSSFCLDYST